MKIGELIEQLGGKLAHGDTETEIGAVNSTGEPLREIWSLPKMRRRRPRRSRVAPAPWC